MQVKVFESTDMASGLKMVKKELGPDALILSTRTIKNGRLGLLSKPILEITAAIDNVMPVKTSNGYGYSSTGLQANINLPPVHHPLQERAPDSDIGYGDVHAATAVSHKTVQEHSMQSEVNELKDLVKGLAGEISQLNEKNERCSSNPSPGLQVRSSSFPDRLNGASLHGDHILSMLIDRGINVETSRTITGFLRESLTEQELTSTELVTETIIDTIQTLMEVAPPVFSSSDTQQRIAFVGPTGVGKTTTLAKIAAAYLIDQSNSIALITIDTYRIAAVEQLKVYGEIMHLPVDVVISPDQLKDALDRHQDKDLILIDTAGRSPRDGFCIDELATFLKPELNIDKHLVLSATTRENELLNIIARFNALGITNTIFTKIDECVNLGILLNIQIQNSNPLSFVTNGQRVPEDIIKISQKTVAELIMSANEGSMHD